MKYYLENTCIEWLRKYVSYGKDVLERREPHSLRYFYTGVSDPSPGVPQFMSVGYVDGHLLDHYDSETQRDEPGADWFAANTDQQYWDRETETLRGAEQIFRVGLNTLRERYNQSRGSHTVQVMFGCDLLEDGSTRGFRQDAYEGRDFIAFDKDTLTFTAADAGAQITKRKWEQEGTVAEGWKQYLENTCIEWLRKYVSYGKDVLERREPHSLRYFYTAVSDPNPGVPQFVAMGSVDGEVFVYYDSETRRKEPRVDWIAANTDQQYWDRETEISQGNEKFFRVNLDTLQERYNQSSGSQTVQHMFGCDLLEDGSIRGFNQYGYEGRDFIALDKDALTFTAADAAALITKRKWEQEGTVAEQMKYYLENTCIEWLRKYVSYGKDVLERREPHSLRYFYAGLSDPSPGVPQFVAVGYVDGEVFVRYDSETRRTNPRVDWIAANTDQQYWDRETDISQSNEKFFRVNLDTLQERYNQSSGSHTVQVMYGCDLLEDGSIRGFQQHGYDGKDFLTFDKDTLTYTAADAVAQITKRKWEEDGSFLEGRKFYLENTCIEWLRKYVSYGKAMLERRERPEVRVSGMEADKILTLSCRAHGFYPRPISISWLKSGVVQEQETKRGSTVPNSDGTYHVWATIDVLPGDRDKYQCRVEHASLPQPGLFSWEPQSNLIPIVAGVAVAVVAVIAALAGFAVWKSKQGKKEKGYNVAPGSDGGSNSSNAGSNPSV
ncbi:uncharacterized protein LOC116500245 isoform X1 [Aythya fuligula]|uniref:Uncharacterized protein LOC116500245 isoform X1 n=1 Tax=Aythya fuligula TaxID=219594 RepID=A0A6J3EI56_AYTFU|nr:uncharacterized protein LOC116500245 isoform X1 [Aythya fuligula]